MPQIRGELIIFLVAVITGILLRLVYQSIDCFRQLVRHSLFVMGIEDIIFWIGSALYVFVQIYYTSDGGIRWYFILGLAFGSAFSSAILKSLKKGRKKIYTDS